MKTNDLKEALKKVMPAIAKDNEITGSNCVIISNEDMMTFNDTMGISCLIPDTQIQCAVIARDFYKVILTIKDPELSLEVKDNKLIVKSETTEAEFAVYPFETVMNVVDSILVDDMTSAPLPSDFIDGINLCHETVTEDYAQNLSLFALKVTNDCMYSASPFKLCKYLMNNSINTTFLIPKSVLKPLMKFQPLSFSIANNWIIFENGENDFLFSRMIEGDFPDVEEIIKQFPSDSNTVELPEDLKPTLKRLIEVHDAKEEYNKHIIVSIKDGCLSLSFQKESMNVKQKLSIAQKDVETTMSISAVFLHSILEIMNTMAVSDKMVRFQNDNFTHLIMLGKM